MRRTQAGVAVLVGALVVAGAGCEPAASPWRSELLSINAAGTNSGNRESGRPVFSPDGTKVAFYSAASDLGPTDNNGATDIYIRDLDTGLTTLLTTNAAGTQAANAQSYWPVFSPDGTKVAFQSDASDLGPIDTNGTTDVYVRDLATGATTLVSVDATGTSGGNDLSVVPVFSPDGTKIAFTSRANDLGPQDTYREGWDDTDIYVRDLIAGSTTLVSADASGTDSGNLESGEPVFSPGSDKIAFVSRASDLGPPDTNAHHDLYLRDLATETTSLVSVNASGTDGGDWSSWARPAFSPDGSRLYFASSARDLVATPDANGISQDIFVRDLTAGTTTLLTTNAAGTSSASTGSASPIPSPDGNLLAFFSDADDLGPTDTNGAGDVYLRDMLTGATRLVSAAASGDDSANAKSVPLGFSPDGTRFLFWSYATDLGPYDSDNPDEEIPPDDPGTGRDLYLRDLESGTTTLVSANASGTDSANHSSGLAVLSPDGARIAFDTRANDLGPTDTNEGESWGPWHDVYLATLHGADVAVTLAAEETAIAPGDSLTYHLDVANTGPDPADGAVVAAVLPDTIQTIAVDAGEATCASPAPDRPNILVCDLGTLTAGSRAAATIRVTLDAAAGTTLTAIALADSAAVDPDTLDNVARVDVPVVEAAVG